MSTNGAKYPYGALGSPLPALTPHAISVSLPTWEDNIDYEEGAPRVIDVQKNGYPRFFIHLSIDKLIRICEQRLGSKGERCLLFPSKKSAERCRAFMQDQAGKQGYPTPLTIRLVHFTISPADEGEGEISSGQTMTESNGVLSNTSSIDLHIVLFDKSVYKLARQFWQHTGMGISSRLADHCLSLLSVVEAETPESTDERPPISPRVPSKPSNRYYSRPNVQNASPKPVPIPKGDVVGGEHDLYLEERYGRNLPLSSAKSAKQALRRRIAGVLVKDDPSTYSLAGDDSAELGPSSRGVKSLSESDVFLFSTGMGAIWNAHNLAREVRPPAKSVCFGFPYMDTLKILQKWGEGCHFLGHGLDSDIDTLEKILQHSSQQTSGPPLLMLITEIPSNPLLRSADLPRLKKLADQYDFLIVVDDSIGNFANVDVLPYADMVVSSLTKIFSGDANVMGGSLVLNPDGRHYAALKSHLLSTYEDSYFDQDAIFMERNSRDFRRRAQVIDSNTELLCDYLFSKSLDGGCTSSVVKKVYYPKYTTPHHYAQCRNRTSGGYGGLFSLTFTSQKAAEFFYDSLQVYKGPSLGTNFTLASPFVILAHYYELDWAESWGVERGLVRVSVGMEEGASLLERFKTALETTEEAVREI